LDYGLTLEDSKKAEIPKAWEESDGMASR